MERENTRIRVPMVSVTPSGITMYNSYIGPRKIKYEEFDGLKESFHEDNIADEGLMRRLENLKDNSHKGLISSMARKKIENACKWLLFLSRDKKIYDKGQKRYIKFKICFVTLTLASEQVHSDQKIKSELFNQLLVELRKDFGINHYLWRAEKQKNGNIHFHLLVNKYIPWESLQKKWNRIQNKLGYIDRYREKMCTIATDFSSYYNEFIGQGTYSQLMQRYMKGRATGWRNPNSTDIHSVKKVKRLDAYLSKYMSKSSGEKGAEGEVECSESLVSGKLWGQSLSMSQLKNISTEIDRELQEEINKLCELYEEKLYKGDYFSFMRISLGIIFKLRLRRLVNLVMEKVYEVDKEYIPLTS